MLVSIISLSFTEENHPSKVKIFPKKKKKKKKILLFKKVGTVTLAIETTVLPSWSQCGLWLQRYIRFSLSLSLSLSLSVCVCVFVLGAGTQTLIRAR